MYYDNIERDRERALGRWREWLKALAGLAENINLVPNIQCQLTHNFL